jgi:hypothetical protein
MSAHLSNELVEHFHAQALTGEDRSVIYDHVLTCEACRRLVVTPQAEAVAIRALTEHLGPPEGEEPYHLDLETMGAFVDDNLDGLDRSTVKLHLDDCAECSAEVTDLRESLATMKAASRSHANGHQAQATSSGRRLVFSTPIRIAAMVAVIAFAAIALVAIFRWRSSGPGQGNEVTTGSRPTPLTSPQVPSLGSSPSPSVNPPQLAENPAPKEPSERRASVVALKDGTNEIALDRGGNVVGLPSLPAASQQAVKEALTEGRLDRPGVLDEVASAEVSVRASSGSEERIGIIYPSNTVIKDNTPTLRWKHSKTAEAYRLEIADETFHQVAKSEDLPPTTQSWTPSAPLKRGGIYTLTIRAVNKGGEPSSLTSQAKFKVLGEDKLRELNQLQVDSRSHLALGLFYVREGMVADAEREFGILVKANPNSGVLKTLLKDVRSWRKP